MTAREPSAVEVIAEALYESVMQATADDWPTWQYLTDFKREPFIDRAMVALVEIKAAGFVVATRDEIRAWPVEQQAGLCPEAMAGALRAAADAMTFDASLRTDERCAAMNDTAHWLRRRADRISRSDR